MSVRDIKSGRLRWKVVCNNALSRPLCGSLGNHKVPFAGRCLASGYWLQEFGDKKYPASGLAAWPLSSWSSRQPNRIQSIRFASTEWRMICQTISHRHNISVHSATKLGLIRQVQRQGSLSRQSHSQSGYLRGTHNQLHWVGRQWSFVDKNLRTGSMSQHITYTVVCCYNTSTPIQYHVPPCKNDGTNLGQ